MRELQDGKGTKRVKKDNKGDEGVDHGTKQDDLGNKKGNLDNCVEGNSRKLKKRKKSKIEVKSDGRDTVNEEKIVSENCKRNFRENKDESLKNVDKKKSKKSKKSKRRKIDEIDGLEVLENNVECVDDEIERELCEEVLFVSKEEEIKTKKSKKKNKSKDMSVSKTIANETSLRDEETIVSVEKDKIKRKNRREKKSG